MFTDRKKVLVTGAGHGLGKALALQAADLGAQVAVWDIDAEAAAQTAALIPDSTFHVGDIGLSDDRLRMKEETLDVHNRVDILVNNAAVSVGGPLASTPVQDIDWLIGINLLAAVHLTHAFLPAMLEQDSGHIVNISSAAGLIGMPYRSLYCATKSGLRGFSESLRAELHETSVGVTIVHPGPVKTDMFRRSRYSKEELREKETAYLSNSGMPPDKLAEAIWRGVGRNAFEVLPGSQATSLGFIRQLMPVTAVKLLGRFRNRLPA